jgi:hypothetical protein
MQKGARPLPCTGGPNIGGPDIGGPVHWGARPLQIIEGSIRLFLLQFRLETKFHFINNHIRSESIHNIMCHEIIDLLQLLSAKTFSKKLSCLKAMLLSVSI